METTENQTPANASGQSDGGGTDPQKANANPQPHGTLFNPAADFAPAFAPTTPPISLADDALDLSSAPHLSTYSVYTSAWRLQYACHNLARAAGWWTRPDGSSVTDNALCFSNKLMLIVSEVSEAMEGDRKGIKDDKLPHRDMREVELADAVIRIFDLAGAYDMDLAGAIVEKLAYNQQRADHKPENRAQAGGKAY